MPQPPGWPSVFEVKPLKSVAITAPAWQHDFEKKQEFGRLIKQGLKPFEAAIKIFMNDNSAALWAANHWPNDQAVKAIVSQEEKDLKLLDKEAIAAKVMAFVDEKDSSGRFYINEGQDRLKALELYAKICGYITNQPIPIAQTLNDNRRMEIVLVSPEKKQDNSIVQNIEETTVETLDLPVKLIN